MITSEYIFCIAAVICFFPILLVLELSNTSYHDLNAASAAFIFSYNNLPLDSVLEFRHM